MIDNGYIFATDNKRIFINTSLGCNGQCSYCYLPKIGYKNKRNRIDTITAEKVIALIKDSKFQLSSNTLITIGCYSECWDDCNKIETIKLIKYFLNFGNQVQLSTKKRILENEFKEIIPFIKYYGQLIIFVSSSTISKQKTIEKNTTPILDRFENFTLGNKLNIPIVLYMKPVLYGITIKDLELYIKYINKYKIKDVVVGSIFTNDISDETVHFSFANELYYNSNADEDVILNELSNITNVYRRSTEVTTKYKKITCL